MSLCILDIPVITVIGFVLALLYAKRWRWEHPDIYVTSAMVVTTLFWLNAVLCAFNVIEPWGAGWLSTEVNGWIALFAVLAYPLWFGWGAERARALFGRSPDQGGFLWPFTLVEKTRPFRPAWHTGARDDE